MKRHLMLITIGPVQSFISQARKAQDLWSGSYFLSYLINEGKNALPQTCQLIFPAKETSLDEQIASLPNRLLFLTDNPEESSETVENAIQTAFKNTVDFALKKLQKYGSLNQLTASSYKNFLEIFQGAIIIDTELDNYTEKYSQLESLVGATKNYRPFEQTDYPKTGHYPIIVCPLCGERHAIALEGKLTDDDVKLLWDKISNENPKIKANEYLCPVCYAKRLFPEFINKENKTELGFPSTADVAVTEWRQNEKNRNYIDEIEQSFKANKHLKNDKGYVLPKLKDLYGNRVFTDAHWYFPDNFTKREFGKLKLEPKNKNSNAYNDYEKERSDFLKLKPFKSPDTSYYGMLMMDGDGMGEMLGKVKNAEDHKNFSKALDIFATQLVPQIVEKEHFGKLVYAGGDDVFGFTTKNDLLNTMNDTRKKFNEIMKENQSQYCSITGNYTMSAGAVVAHYKAPLFYVLDQVREMEKKAKSFVNESEKKNACALMLLSHGGNNKFTIFPWEYKCEDGKISESVILLNNLRNDLSEEFISKTFIYKLKDEFDPLLDIDGFLKTSEDIFIEEFKRIFMRAVMNKSKKNEMEKRQDELLVFWYKAMKKNVRNFNSFMEIASVFNRRNV